MPRAINITQTVNVDVDVDVSDVLAELSDEELKYHLQERYKALAPPEVVSNQNLFLTKIRRAFETGDKVEFEEALLMIEEPSTIKGEQQRTMGLYAEWAKRRDEERKTHLQSPAGEQEQSQNTAH